MINLIINAFQVGRLRPPELDLDIWAGIESLENRLRGVLLEHLVDVMCPVNDDRLDGVDDISCYAANKPFLWQ